MKTRRNGMLSARGWFAAAWICGAMLSTLEAAPLTSQVEMVVTFKGKDQSIVIELDEVNAPQTSQNFRKLCNNGFYNGTIFHRVIPGYIVQAGDPLSKEPLKRGMWGTGGPGYTLPAELGKPHLKGSLAMARLSDAVNPAKESSGSQFYVALDKIESLDGEYTVFGNVVSGLETLVEIGNAAADKSNVPVDRILIKSARVLGEAPAVVPAPAPVPKPLPAPITKVDTPAPAPPIQKPAAPAPSEGIRDITPPSKPSETGNPAQPVAENWPKTDAPANKPASKPKKREGPFTKFMKRIW